MLRARNLITLVAVFVLVAGLAFVTVTLTPSQKPAVPVQQTGTAAGFPHRTSASADTGHIVDGKVVSGSASASQRAEGPAAESAARVKGSVPPAARPKPVRFPVRGGRHRRPCRLSSRGRCPRRPGTTRRPAERSR